MPLQMKTLREASIELSMPESEIRVLVDSRKIRSVMKKGLPTFAPDEIAKIKRLRKTLPDSAIKSVPEPVAPPKPAAPRPAPPPRRPPPPPRKPEL
jgi:hypothetical protein